MNITQQWALILGASSGFGAAAARALAQNGYHILGFHLDRAATMPAVEQLIADIEAAGVKAVFHNVNAADAEKRKAAMNAFVEEYNADGSANIRLLLHSLAFGTLRPLVGRHEKEAVTKSQVDMTLDVMANTLIYWTQEVIHRNLMKPGGRIFAMTSDGANLNLPYYGVVSAAKCALESYVRQLAMELGAIGITVNALMAGVTDTPALNKIPGARHMIHAARSKNPFLRVTNPEDIAQAILMLLHPGGDFVSGNTIGVDGGESKITYIGQVNAYQYSNLERFIASADEPSDS